MALVSAVSDYRAWQKHKKTVRKLQALRQHASPAGYTLSSFDHYRCIFVHIPKCAGVSVCQSLFGNYGAGHHPIGLFRDVFERELFDSYFKFTFVRNPWDRLLSAYEFLQRGGFNETDRRWARHQLSAYRDFGHFVRDWVTPANVSSWIHFRPQIDFLGLSEERSAMDFIGRYEHLEEHFREVCVRLGVRRRLCRLNTDGRNTRDYRNAYDAQTRAIVGDVYARDIAALSYCFDDGDAAVAASQEQGKQNHAES